MIIASIFSAAGQTVRGECTCPAFEDHGFCKHMVATALAANEREGGGPNRTASSPLARIRAHLAARERTIRSLQ